MADPTGLHLRSPAKTAVLGTSFQQALAFQIPGQTGRNGVDVLCRPIVCQRLNPAKQGCGTFVFHIDTIEKQHAKMNIRIQRTAKALNQADRTGVHAGYSRKLFLNEKNNPNEV